MLTSAARPAPPSACARGGPDEWAVVRTRILERDSAHTEDDLDRMQAAHPAGTRTHFGHFIEDADRSARCLARAVEENT